MTLKKNKVVYMVYPYDFTSKERIIFCILTFGITELFVSITKNKVKKKLNKRYPLFNHSIEIIHDKDINNLISNVSKNPIIDDFITTIFDEEDL